MEEEKYIGLISTHIESLKPEYRKMFGKKTRMVMGTIRTDKKYGAKVVLDTGEHFLKSNVFNQSNKTIKQLNRIKTRMEKRLTQNTPIDTSKWVRPDDRSLKLALIKNLFGLELTLEGTCKHAAFEGRTQTLMQILNQKSPKNPQSLGCDYAILDPLVQVLNETKPKLRQEEYNIIFSGQTWGKHKYPGKLTGIRETRRKLKAWRSKIRNGMISVKT